MSYSIGLDIGTTLKRQLIDVNETLLSQGVHDGVTGGKPLLTDEQVKEVMGNFQKDMLAKQAAARKVTGEKCRGGEEISRAEQEQTRNQNYRQRFAVQGREGRLRRLTEGERYG